MGIIISLNAAAIADLDLTPAEKVLTETLADRDRIIASEQQLQFAIDFPRDPSDPRELSEIAEIRLWFLRLDARHPYLPFFLDWQAGELARYTAMLVPHQFSRSEGIIYNPEALELFVTQKCFLLVDWMRDRGITGTARLQNLAKMFGYEMDASFFKRLAEA
ncbi:MAG: CRR6 family NdhI maturation factor [Cyanobacteria bacterium J06641_5]